MSRRLRGPHWFFVLPLLFGVGFFLAHLTATAPSGEPTLKVGVGDPQTVLAAYVRWKSALTQSGEAGTLALPLSWWKGRSVEYTTARGDFRLDLVHGALTVRASGLPAGEHELWLVDAGERGRADVRRLGALQVRDGVAELETRLRARDYRGFRIDRVVLAAAGADPLTEGLLHGSPSLFQRLYYDEQRRSAGAGSAFAPAGDEAAETGFLGAALASLVPAPAYAQGVNAVSGLADLVSDGETLFFTETFAGNGRTCGTCHPAENNFTLDTTFIATRPSNDPLFVAEFDTALAQLENPVLMRQFALILANVDGFEDPTNKFVMRAVPHLLGLANSIASGSGSPPLDRMGWGGDGAPGQGRLRDFAIGAVRQHFTKSLNRVENTDFRLPTEPELDALEAFMLSLGRPSDPDLPSMKLVNVQADSGRVLFLNFESTNGPTSKCNVCHVNAGASSMFQPGVNENFNTGVEDRPHPAAGTGQPRPRDGGFGTTFNPGTGGFGNGEFNSTTLIESADTGPYFHNNVIGDLKTSVNFYITSHFNNSPSGQLMRSIDSQGIAVNTGPDEITTFLRVLNVLENLRSAIAYESRAIVADSFPRAKRLIQLARADNQDARQVLAVEGLHNSAQPHLQAADSLCASADTTSDGAVRNSLLSQAIDRQQVARSLMIQTTTTAAEPPVHLGFVDLAPAQPSPFRDRTTIRYRLGAGGRVLLSVYDARGRLVRRLVDGPQDAGEYAVHWDGRGSGGRVMPAGAYFFKLRAGVQERTRSVIRLP